MDVKKVMVHKDDSISIDYERITAAPEGEKAVFEKIHFKSNRPAHADFYATLSGLKPFALKMLEINDKEINRIQVKGVKFTRTKEGIMGVQIFVERSMNNTETPIMLETPHYISESYFEDGDELNILESESLEFFENLQIESIEYVSGKSDQVEMDV